jgi:hypothetical protein
MSVYLRAARDAVATVGAAYIPFGLVRVIAYPEFDIYPSWPQIKTFMREKSLICRSHQETLTLNSGHLENVG